MRWSRMYILFILAVYALVLTPTAAPAQTPEHTSSTQNGITIGGITVERFDPKSNSLHAAIMLVHGAGGAEGPWRSNGMLEALTAAGYSVFVPHYFELGEWDKSKAGELFPKYVEVLQNVLRGIGDMSGIDKQKGIGLVGFSLGSYLILGLATDAYWNPSDVGIKAVVEMYGAMPDFAAAHMTTMPPVLILHGGKDETVPTSKAYELDKLLSEKNVSHEVKIYPDQGHGFSGNALKDSRERSIEFLKLYLH